MTDHPNTAEPTPGGGAPARSGLSPRKKQQISRGVQYFVLAAVVVFLALRIEWGKLGGNFTRPDIAEKTLPDLFTIALKNTIIYSVGGFVFAFLLGLLFALMRLS